MPNKALYQKFPWLAHLKPTAEKILQTLHDKEVHYEGSWQKRGGIGAYMMTARKTDRVEGIVSKHGYDIFAAMMADTGGVIDDIDDLIGYLLLIRANHELLKESSPEFQAGLALGEEPSAAYVAQGADK